MADEQTFNDHSTRHEQGGADEIDLAGLSGESAELGAHKADYVQYQRKIRMGAM